MGYQQQVVMRKVIFFALLWLGLGFAPSTIVAASEKPLTAEVVLSPSEFSAEQVIQLQAKLNLPVGYKAYQDKFAVSIVQPEGFKISNFQIEPLEKFYDKFSKKQRQGFKNSSRLSAYVEAPKVFDGAMDSMLIRINYQACTDTSRLFYLPRRPPGGVVPETAVVAGQFCDIFQLPSAAPPQGTERHPH